MKRLLIMRHAKSAWPEGVDDHDRPLNKRGNKAAPKMANLLLQKKFLPDAAIVSSAKRTLQTWQHMSLVFQQNGLQIPMKKTSDFYMTGLGAIQRSVMVTTHGETLLVLGHNYGWSEAVARLSSRNVELKTANIAVLEHSGNTWSEAIQTTTWTLTDFITPRDIL